MRTLPSGTVTLLFTDIEGSTRLLHELGDRYAEVLSEHRRLLRSAFNAHGGVEVDTQGDAFFVAFHRAEDAVEAATDAQRATANGRVRARMGIHTGRPALREDGYIGIDVHRGARICAAGHGGQVLLSVDTRRALGPGPRVRDLGEHRLKDLPAPEWLFQLLAPELETRFPPLRSLNNTNLPVSASSLIGRERELSEIGALLARDDIHLVTLSGPGGSGKTRLALGVAASLVERFKNGVFLVELAAVVEPAQVLPTIARTLGAREAGDDPLETLRRALEGKTTLLVLDNLEQVIEAAPDIARLIESAADLKVLVTSRERLRIGGEHEYGVEPLPEEHAIELFDTRARAIVPGFQLAPHRTHVVAICRRLDGLPLAIELAAARVKLLGPEEMLARLERHLPVFGQGMRDAPQRQQTLNATIDWSYALLEADEQQVFARLSTFVGGFTTSAAEDVCDASVNQLASLLDKSLLRNQDSGGGSRFTMLETIHEYAAEQLLAARAAGEWRDRHARYHASLAEAARHETLAGEQPSAEDAVTSFSGGPNESPALDRLAPERDNLTAALGWFVERAQTTSAVSLVLDLVRLWLVRGTLADGRRWTETVMSLKGAEESPDFPWLLTLASEFPRWQGDFSRARVMLERAVAGLSGSAEDARREAAIYALANIFSLLKDFPRARALAEAALTRGRAAQSSMRVWRGLNALGVAAFYEGDFARMATLAAEELEVAHRLRSPNAISAAAHNAAEARRNLGELARAAGHYQEGIAVGRSLGDYGYVAECLDGVGDLAAALGDPSSAAPLWAAGQRILEDAEMNPWDPDGQRQGIAVARASMGNEAFEAAWRLGLALTDDDAFARAAAVIARASATG